MLFSNILRNHLASNQNIAQICNQTVEFDQAVFTLQHSFSFYDCELVLAPSIGPSVTLFSEQLLRFENCALRASICIWGRQGGAGYEPLEQVGPSVFFENCSGNTFRAQIAGSPLTDWKPKVQVSGFTDHVRINPSSSFPFELTISQIRFSKLEIVGEFTQLQLVEYVGKEVFFKRIKVESIWIRENLAQIPFVDFDGDSVSNISCWLRSIKYEIPHLFQTIEMILEVLIRSKQGRSFLLINDALCTYVAKRKLKNPIKNFQELVIYGFFRRFYALGPMVILSFGLVLVFSALYLSIASEPVCSAFQNSLFAFSGNPSNSGDKPYLYNSLGAMEAYFGIFAVIVSSLILARKYSAHR